MCSSICVCVCACACCVLRVYTGVAERGKQTSPRSNECSLGSLGILVPIKQRTKMLSSQSHHLYPSQERTGTQKACPVLGVGKGDPCRPSSQDINHSPLTQSHLLSLSLSRRAQSKASEHSVSSAGSRSSSIPLSRQGGGDASSTYPSLLLPLPRVIEPGWTLTLLLCPCLPEPCCREGADLSSSFALILLWVEPPMDEERTPGETLLQNGTLTSL